MRQHKRLMQIASVLLLLSGAAVVAIGLTAPIQVDVAEKQPIVRSSNGLSQVGTTDDGQTFGLTLADVRSVTAIDLRRPLYDVVVAKTTAEDTIVRGSSLPIRLLAIANEPETGQPIATFIMTDGKTKPFAVGELIEDAGKSYTVESVARDHVIVKTAGVSHELYLPETP